MAPAVMGVPNPLGFIAHYTRGRMANRSDVEPRSEVRSILCGYRRGNIANLQCVRRLRNRYELPSPADESLDLPF